MKQNTTIKSIVWKSSLAVCLFAGILIAINACKKSGSAPGKTQTATENATGAAIPLAQNQPQTEILNVAAVRTLSTGNVEVLFYQNEEVFTVQGPAVISLLNGALSSGQAVKVTFDSWKAVVTQAVMATSQEAADNARAAAPVTNAPVSIDLATMNTDLIDNINNNNIVKALMPINTTGGSSLTSVIPDMATAQLMFNYITKQCCALAGPYAIDYCISFQYCEDGCYARANKMCWIINTKFNYATQKVFSFANAGHDELCVKGEKWGGCCINWWYHVAPLVTINTPTGPKAYVFDPAMFDQPVLLSSWLHAQENPACVPGGDNPHVSMINVQPTSSYSPTTYSGYTFDTDPTFAQTDTTLVHYSILTTCP